MSTPRKSQVGAADATEVIIHPLVLLSVTDHYNRVAKDTRKRVVGVLLGSRVKNRVDITNSFAVPFEEDLNNPTVWFLDHNFLESMFWMFKKVNTREEMMGFYSSGPKIKENDLKISSLFRRFCTNEPVFAIIDVRPGVVGIPTTSYEAVDEVEAEGKEIQRVFKHVSCTIEADEAEEVGVEHLLRDINDPSTGTLALEVQHKVSGLTGLLARLSEIRAYLERVIEGRIPINNQITYNLQNIFNLLPNLNVEELVKSLFVKTNDIHLVLYVSALVRSVLALHDLLANKIKYRDIDAVLDNKDTELAGTGASSAGKDGKDGAEDEQKGSNASSPLPSPAKKK
ncbi:26S proteasome regulatory subunit N8 [Ochromonadaceae sp. CCMP2298]|nr:26S proteasome regulatory subunit N8 [Ochromonadaceae sp. CCMP2298]|mmetsp:Transcript_26628/g.60260  ORF Transcript_26628/g.60260 Transcript_26628/m.60260 type:complete len:341 (-) Transcript_26628:128-1150(-)|eukprot:CAMPEP_0173177638 /NCGR_PEP_ID=MMETSP1141-20130122/5099_1 /TAXON_ID=483371 /ORGANISM="non described non described, Strain CCMP2298" /LENGTH=340 /DNA_ID=CAMNT_0014100055 /DNA_START=114 /DNA_END=1136 /DNA_ORIENTATION=-